MRAFVAVELSDDIRNALGEVISKMGRFDLPVKWVEPANLHLTLKFLGEVDEESAPAVARAMREAARSAAPFDLRLTRAGAFPSLARPRVLFIEADDDPPVTEELARRLDDAMSQLGVPREVRPFRKHVTLGRVRRPAPLGLAADELRSLASKGFGPMKVGQIVLMRSQLTPSGPIYEAVERANLG